MSRENAQDCNGLAPDKLHKALPQSVPFQYSREKAESIDLKVCYRIKQENGQWLQAMRTLQTSCGSILIQDHARHALGPVLRGREEEYLMVQFVDKGLASDNFLFLSDGDNSDTWDEVVRIARTATKTPVGLQIEIVAQRGCGMYQS